MVPSKKVCRIAVISLKHMAFHQHATNLLYKQIEADVSNLYQLAIYTLPLDKSEIQKTVHSLMRNKTDLFITIGECCSQYTKEVLDEYGGHPMIFIGVRNPVELKLVSFLEKPGFYLTGVMRDLAPRLKLASNVELFSPVIRSLLVPYLKIAGAGALAIQVLDLKNYLESKGMEVLAVPISENVKEIMNVLKHYSDRVQGVLFMEGCMSNAIQNKTAYFCWEKCLVFFGSGPSAINIGAACALSGDITQMVAKVFEMVQAHWEHGVQLGTIPVASFPNNEEFYVNIDALRKISFPPDVLKNIISNPTVKVERIWIKLPK